MVPKIQKYWSFLIELSIQIRVIPYRIRPDTCSNCSGYVPSITPRALSNGMLRCHINQNIIFNFSLASSIDQNRSLICQNQGCQTSWFDQESPDFLRFPWLKISWFQELIFIIFSWFFSFSLIENLLISGADFYHFLLILVFP
jgi:hypothetical protein